MSEQKKVWMRAEDAEPQEQEFDEDHANRILALEKRIGVKNWTVIKTPSKNGKTNNGGSPGTD